MRQLTVDNHYVPQHYLRGWSEDCARVESYPLVAPSATERLWKARAIRSVAVQSHLYTSVLGGTETDAFEVWANDEIEQPAIEAIDRVRQGRRMFPDDWRRLARYVAMLDRRTPAAYLEHMRWFDTQGQQLLDDTLARWRERVLAGEPLGVPRTGIPKRDPGPGELPIRVWTETDPVSGQMLLRVELTAGRELWLHNVRQAVETTARALMGHRWMVMTPPAGLEWLTSDHPVMRLNYHNDAKYDFEGGWGSPGTEIMLPLSPQHLLYTRVGGLRSRKREASTEMARLIRRLTVEHAHRWIFARTADAEVPILRPRTVDRALYLAERAEWSRWHSSQGEAEAATVALPPQDGEDRATP